MIENNCTTCGKRIDAAKFGSLTQWLLVDSCRCNSPVNTVTPIDVKTSKTCNKCGRPSMDGRAGSLTQWIFSDLKCRCDLDASSLTGGFDSGPVYSSYGFSPGIASALIDELESGPIDYHGLPVDSFPFERYRIISEKGRGNAGIVYEAWDCNLKKRVAIKTLYHDAWGAEDLMRFQHEARATSRLEHPNITRVLDFGAAPGGQPYMVSEYVNGGDLKELIEAQGPLEPGQAVPIFIQICEGMAYAHEHGLFHRDLKSSNVMFDVEHHRVKIIDFGIASVAQEMTLSPEAQGLSVVGSPFYMSPDQVKGLKYDARSDIYSVGCIMFETLTGRVPFVAGTAMATLSQHANHDIPFFRDILDREFENHRLEQIVRKALSKDRDLRQPSAETLKAELTKISETGSINEVQAETGSARSRSGTAPGILAVAMVLIVFAVVGVLALNAVSVGEVSKEKTTKEKSRDDVDRSALDVFEMEGEHCRTTTPASPENLKALVKYKRDEIKWLALNGGLSTYSQTLTANEWRLIAKLPLVGLEASGSTTSDLAAPYIEKMTHLEELALSRTNISDKTLSVIPETVKRLYLMHTRITGQGFSRFNQLTVLNVYDTDVTDEAVVQLDHLTGLQELSLGSCDITDQCMSHVAKHKRLTRLDLTHTGITESGIKLIDGLPLTRFAFEENPQCNDRCVETIVRQFPNLAQLHLSGSRITKAGVDRLSNLHNLQELSLCHMDLQDADLASIDKLDRLVSLRLMSNKISDKTIERLLRLKSIRTLALSGCVRVSDTAVNKLRKKGVACDDPGPTTTYGQKPIFKDNIDDFIRP